MTIFTTEGNSDTVALDISDAIADPLERYLWKHDIVLEEKTIADIIEIVYNATVSTLEPITLVPKQS